MATASRHFMVMPDFSRAGIASIWKMDGSKGSCFKRERETERDLYSLPIRDSSCQNISWVTVIDECVLIAVSFGLFVFENRIKRASGVVFCIPTAF